MKFKIKHILLFFSLIAVLPIAASPAGNVYKKLTVSQCDSLIKANAANPNFVILDVRTLNEWTGGHLKGSINRNYYDSDFQQQLDALPKHKIFLIHCQSGGRSRQAFIKMQNSDFAEVYDMVGGIGAWKKSYPITTVVAPKLMLASNGGISSDTISYGKADTLNITVTNRANDVLKFISVTLPDGDEFATNFDINTELSGAEDYSFQVFYSPNNAVADSTDIVIASNGGSIRFKIILQSDPGVNSIFDVLPEFVFYPNPVKNRLLVKNILSMNIEKVTLINLNGQIVLSTHYSGFEGIDVSELKNGVYFARLKTDAEVFSQKVIVRH